MQLSVITKGFLFHAPTHQVLLIVDPNSPNQELSLFTADGESSKNTADTFKTYIKKTLGLEIPLAHIKEVYDYQCHETKKSTYVHYAHLPRLIDTQKISRRCKAQWIPFTKIAKCKLSRQTKHDITIAERVIRAHLEGNNAR